MRVIGLAPLRVKLESGSIRNAQLPGQKFHHWPRDNQRIRAEPAYDTDRGQLNSESKTVVHASAAAGHRQIGIVQPTRTLQVLPRYLIRESAEPGGLLIT